MTDCARDGHERCILKGETFEAGLPATEKRYTINGKDSLNAALESIRAANKHEQNDISICLRMGVCPVGLIDPFTRECWELFNSIKDGQAWPWGGGFYGQPHVFYLASKILSSELAAIEAEEKRQRDGK